MGLLFRELCCHDNPMPVQAGHSHVRDSFEDGFDGADYVLTSEKIKVEEMSFSAKKVSKSETRQISFYTELRNNKTFGSRAAHISSCISSQCKRLFRYLSTSTRQLTCGAVVPSSVLLGKIII